MWSMADLVFTTERPHGFKLSYLVWKILSKKYKLRDETTITCLFSININYDLIIAGSHWEPSDPEIWGIEILNNRQKMCITSDNSIWLISVISPFTSRRRPRKDLCKQHKTRSACELLRFYAVCCSSVHWKWGLNH